MPTVRVAELKPGHVISRPVLAAGGQVLVQSGTSLTEKLIGQLGAYGIDSVTIASSDQTAAEESEAALRAMEQRFAEHEQDPVMMDLRRIVGAIIQARARGNRQDDAR